MGGVGIDGAAAMTPGARSATTIAATPAGDDPVRPIQGLLLRGEGRGALDALRAARARTSRPADRDALDCIERALTADPPDARPDAADRSAAASAEAEPIVDRVLARYRRYWREGLMDASQRPRLEAELLDDLRAWLALPTDASTDAVQDAVGRRMTEAGWHSLRGRTAPFLELMLWKHETRRRFRVPLPEGRFDADVVLLEGFRSGGWSSWATCGRSGTAGWATEAALYAPVHRYPAGLGHNTFRAVFLTHETQHLADRRNLPQLAGWELEYRAKLAELWAADAATAAARLASFAASRSDDPTLAHPYANAKVLDALESAGGRAAAQMPPATLQRLAAQRLRQDTAARRPSAAKPAA